MKFRKLLYIVCAITFLGVGGCTGDDPEDNGAELPPRLEGIRDGTATGKGDGFGSYLGPLGKNDLEGTIGQQISLTIDVKDGFITEVTIIGPDETPAMAGPLLINAPAVIKAKNTFDLEKADINGTTGATLSFNGIKEAGNDALDQLRE